MQMQMRKLNLHKPHENWGGQRNKGLSSFNPLELKRLVSLISTWGGHGLNECKRFTELWYRCFREKFRAMCDRAWEHNLFFIKFHNKHKLLSSFSVCSSSTRLLLAFNSFFCERAKFVYAIVLTRWYNFQGFKQQLHNRKNNLEQQFHIFCKVNPNEYNRFQLCSLRHPKFLTPISFVKVRSEVFA